MKFDDSFKEELSTFIRKSLFELTNEDPQDLFIEYVIVMIINRKNEAEILNELKDFFEFDIAKKFCKSLKQKLNSLKISNERKPETIEVNIQSNSASISSTSQLYENSQSEIPVNDKSNILKRVGGNVNEHTFKKQKESIEVSDSASNATNNTSTDSTNLINLAKNLGFDSVESLILSQQSQIDNLTKLVKPRTKPISNKLFSPNYQPLKPYIKPIAATKSFKTNVAKNKKWTRDPDLSSSLVSNR